MPASLEALCIDRWTVQERLDLIDRIYDSLPTDVMADDVPARHWDVLAERLAEAETSTVPGRPWREALARFDGKP